MGLKKTKPKKETILPDRVADIENNPEIREKFKAFVQQECKGFVPIFDLWEFAIRGNIYEIHRRIEEDLQRLEDEQERVLDKFPCHKFMQKLPNSGDALEFTLIQCHMLLEKPAYKKFCEKQK